MARTAPAPPGAGQRDVRGVGRGAVADDLGERLRAARAGVVERLQDDDAGALADHEAVAAAGRRAAMRRSGSSLRVESARIAAKPPTSDSCTVASVPPASIMSASPRRIVSQASPMEWPPVAQAETTPKLGPCGPKMMADHAGREVADRHRDQERRHAVRVRARPSAAPGRPGSGCRRCRSRSTTPVRSASSPSRRAGSPAWSIAWRAATSANWT